jgi:hypothetical protein
MPLITKMPRRVLLLRRLRIARDKRVAMAHEAGERERAMRRLLADIDARAERP